MKRILLPALLLLAVLTAANTGCSNNNKGTDSSAVNSANSTEGAVATSAGNQTDSAAVEENAVAQNPVTVSSKGTINEKEWKGGQTAEISISHISTTVADFKDLQEKIGKTPEGAVVLQLVAQEMLCKNNKVGEACIKLCNVESNVAQTLRQLKQIYNTKDANYYRPYQVASFIDGAKPQNGYNPTKPYTFKMRSSASRKYERSEMLKGYVLYLEVLSSGFETMPWRSCEVIKQKGSDFYKVSNCPALLSQCKEVSFDADKDYAGL